MQVIRYHSQPLALWHELVLDAERHAKTILNEELEHYLVSLLLRYTDKSQFSKNVLGKLFLEAQHKALSYQLNDLRTIGDECLLIAGLFPERIAKRLVTVDYFIGIGRSAYWQLFKTNHNELYQDLSFYFPTMISVLHSVRRTDDREWLELPWKIMKSVQQ